jgi:hypothetical protein
VNDGEAYAEDEEVDTTDAASDNDTYVDGGEADVDGVGFDSTGAGNSTDGYDSPDGNDDPDGLNSTDMDDGLEGMDSTDGVKSADGYNSTDGDDQYPSEDYDDMGQTKSSSFALDAGSSSASPATVAWSVMGVFVSVAATLMPLST